MPARRRLQNVKGWVQKKLCLKVIISLRAPGVLSCPIYYSDFCRIKMMSSQDHGVLWAAYFQGLTLKLWLTMVKLTLWTLYPHCALKFRWDAWESLIFCGSIGGRETNVEKRLKFMPDLMITCTAAILASFQQWTLKQRWSSLVFVAILLHMMIQARSYKFWNAFKLSPLKPRKAMMKTCRCITRIFQRKRN